MTLLCPDCAGAKTFTGFVCRYGSDGGHGSVETYNCHTCNGAGEITDAHAEMIAIGKQWRDERRARDESVIEAAKRIGIKPSVLSALEHGRLTFSQAIESGFKITRIGTRP